MYPRLHNLLHTTAQRCTVVFNVDKASVALTSAITVCAAVHAVQHHTWFAGASMILGLSAPRAVLLSACQQGRADLACRALEELHRVARDQNMFFQRKCPVDASHLVYPVQSLYPEWWRDEAAGAKDRGDVLKALRAACIHGHTQCVHALMSEVLARMYAGYHQEDAWTVCREALLMTFIEVCARGHTQCVEAMFPVVATLSHFKDLDRYTLSRAFAEACKGGHTATVRLLLPTVVQYGCATWGFQNACIQGHVQCVRDILQADADSPKPLEDHYLQLSFEYACTGNHVSVVKEILKLQGDRWAVIQKRLNRIFSTTCTLGAVDTARLLLELEGERRVQVDMNELFISVCQYGWLDVAKLLLSLEGDRWVDVHARNDAAFNRSVWSGRNPRVTTMLLGLKGDRAIDPKRAL